MLDALRARRPRRRRRRPARRRRARPRRRARRRRRRARACDGVDAVCHQAAMVGLGVDFDDVTAYVAHNDLGTAVLLRALAARALPRAARARVSMVVYGEGRYRCAAHGVVAPGAARRGATSTPAASSRRCPRCGARARARAGRRGRAARPAQRLRRDEAPPGAPRRRVRARDRRRPSRALRYHNVYGPRMPRDTPYAGVASIFRSALAGRARAAGVRGRRAAARLRPRPRRRARQRPGADGAEPRRRARFNVASGDAAHASASWPPRWPPRAARRAARRSSPASTGSATCATSSPRPSARARRARLPAPRSAFADGMREFARAPLRAVAAV